MSDVMIFSGTAEGRALAEFCSRTWTSALVCVTSESEEDAASDLPNVVYHAGPIDQATVAELLRHEQPCIVIDASPPSATLTTKGIIAACADFGIPYQRVRRLTGDSPRQTAATMAFPTTEEAVAKLATLPGRVFATTGVEDAAGFSRLDGFRDRVVLRILPAIDNIRQCLELGFPVEHLVAMPEPFDRGLSAALFRHFGATILVTNGSEDDDGTDDVAAARESGMTIVAITKSGDAAGVDLETAERIITTAVLGG